MDVSFLMLFFSIKLWRIVLLATWLAMSSIWLAAQDVTLGDSLEAELEAGGADRWTFVARDGQMLSVHVRSLDEEFDPIVSIVDERSGTVLISNDDYDYPNSRDALIEAFSAPRTGTYAIEVRGYGDTAGNYEVSLSQGYSISLEVPAFPSDMWELVNSSETSEATLETSADALVISQAGISQDAIALGPEFDVETYYADLSVMSIGGTQGWRLGMVYGYQDEANYSFINVNDAGAWRAVRLLNGTEIVLRDWGGHPAIVAGQSRFRLGVFVREGGADVFYDGQYIGFVASGASPAARRLGVSIQTPSAIGSSVTARVNDLSVTTPRLPNEDDSIFPAQLVASGDTYTVRELERRGFVPAGGAMVLNLAESFAQNVVAGISRFSLASETEFSNLIFGTTVSWRTIGDGISGCGIILRDMGENDDYILGYVDSVGGSGLARRSGNRFDEAVYVDQLPNTDSTYDLLLIAVGERVFYYVDGYYVGQLEMASGAGGIGEAVVNFEALDTACRFDDLWVWRLHDD